jgi:hypothetical protein
VALRILAANIGFLTEVIRGSREQPTSDEASRPWGVQGTQKRFAIYDEGAERHSQACQGCVLLD